MNANRNALGASHIFAALAVLALGIVLAPDASAQTLAAAGNKTCVVTPAGTARCWGVIGEFVGEPWGNTDFVAKPTDRKELTNVTDIALSEDHACARLRDGTLRCWGYNDYGQLGNGLRLGRYPVDIPKPALTKLFHVADLTGVSQVATGDTHTCAISSGRVHCWGNNAHGQVGGKDGIAKTPKRVIGVPTVERVTCGGSHSCAVTASGEVHCWGSHGAGQLGLGPLTSKPGDPEEREARQRVPPTRVKVPPVAVVTASDDATCALTTTGEIWCWGALYAITGAQSDVPVQIPLADKPSDIAVGNGLCALLPKGGVTCRGEMASALRGGGPDRWERVLVTGATSLAMGNQHACARAGNIKCWGSRRAVLPTVPDETDVPVDVVGFGDIVDLRVRDATNCARDKRGVVRCWGGTEHDNALPTLIRGLPTGTKMVSAGPGFGCAVGAKGNVSCWGRGVRELGLKSSARNTAIAVKLPGPATSISTSWGRACATLSGGRVSCFGHSHVGESMPPLKAPTLAPGLVDQDDVASGRCHSLSLGKDGVVRAWGCNRAGRLGTGTFVEHGTVQSVVGLGPRITQIVADELSCARASTGRAWCWGNTAYTAIPFTETDIIDIDTAERRTCIVRKGGGVFCGLPNQLKKRDLPPAKLVRMGRSHTCVVLESGRAKCWGRRSDGRLGDGIPDFVRTPRIVNLN